MRKDQAFIAQSPTPSPSPTPSSSTQYPTDLDWTTIIVAIVGAVVTGVSTGFLSALVTPWSKLATDVKREKRKNREELLAFWDSLLSDKSCGFEYLKSQRTFPLLISLISGNSCNYISQLESQTKNKLKEIEVRAEERERVWQDAMQKHKHLETEESSKRLYSLQRGFGEIVKEREEVEEKARQELVSCLQVEIIRLRKKWGMF